MTGACLTLAASRLAKQARDQCPPLRDIGQLVKGGARAANVVVPDSARTSRAGSTSSARAFKSTQPAPAGVPGYNGAAAPAPSDDPDFSESGPAVYVCQRALQSMGLSVTSPFPCLLAEQHLSLMPLEHALQG